MPKQILSLETDEKPRLELEWGGYMRDFRVRLDGEQIEHITGGQRELKEGRDIPLPDGSMLTIKLATNGMMEELQVLRDGVPLPGSAADPTNQFSASIRVGFFWGLITAVLHILAMFAPLTDTLFRFTLHPYTIFTGLGLIAAVYLLATGRRWAGILAFLLFLFDCGFGIFYCFNVGAYVPFVTTAAIFGRIFVLMRLLPTVRTSTVA